MAEVLISYQGIKQIQIRKLACFIVKIHHDLCLLLNIAQRQLHSNIPFGNGHFQTG